MWLGGGWHLEYNTSLVCITVGAAAAAAGQVLVVFGVNNAHLQVHMSMFT